MLGLKAKHQRDLSAGKHLQSKASLEIITSWLKCIRLFIHIHTIEGGIWLWHESVGKCQWETNGKIHDLE